MNALRALVARVLHAVIRQIPPAPLSLDELRERAFAEIDTELDRLQAAMSFGRGQGRASRTAGTN